MEQGRVFTDQELEHLTQSPFKLAKEAVRRGDDEEALTLIDDAYNEVLLPHDLYRDWLRECVEATAAIWRGHFSEFELREDSEKVTFVLKPCGSGGRQLQDGKYGPPLNLLRIRDPQVMTGQTADCPLYCAHCVSMTEAMMDLGMGFIYVVEVEDGKDNPEHLFHIYKDPSKVPQRIYRAVKREKPA
jgi:hypothetical protein